MIASTHQDLDSPSLSPQVLHQPNSVLTGSEQLHPLRNNGATRVVEMQKIQTDSTSDKATAAFVRRTLCSHNVLLGNGEKGLTTPRPIEEVLPPLTSSNDIDLQLYGIISVIIKEFVQIWYSKITPDHVFVNEVLQTIAHCTRGFEQRLRKVDLEALLLDELPELLEKHLNSIRLAKQQASNSHALASDYRLIYHTLHPHPALSPVPTESVPSTSVEQRENESAWRQLLIQGILAVLLPTEDLENGCLRALVAEIFAEMILGNGISGKACEGWLLCEGITSIAKVLQTDAAKEEDVQPNSATPEQSMTRLEQYGLLSTGPQAQLGSINQPTLNKRSHKTWPVFLSGLFWMFVQYVLWASAAVRGAILILAASSSLPTRSTNHELSPAEASIQPQAPAGNAPSFRRPLRNKRPVVSMKLWSCMAQVAELTVRMPWLWGTASMLHWGLLMGPGKVGDTDGILDRLLSNVIHKRILNPIFVPAVLRTLRATLFPNNTLGPPRRPPSDDEIKEIKHRCAVSILGLVPANLAATILAVEDRDAQLADIEYVLRCLDDSYLNKHLIFQIVDLVILRLVPELGRQGVRDLMEERSVDAHTDLLTQSSSRPG